MGVSHPCRILRDVFILSRSIDCWKEDEVVLLRTAVGSSLVVCVFMQGLFRLCGWIDVVTSTIVTSNYKRRFDASGDHL